MMRNTHFYRLFLTFTFLKSGSMKTTCMSTCSFYAFFVASLYQQKAILLTKITNINYSLNININNFKKETSEYTFKNFKYKKELFVLQKEYHINTYFY